MLITSMDDDIYAEFDEVIGEIYEMVKAKSKKFFRKSVPYLQLGVLEELGASGFADFIANFDEEFKVIDCNIGSGLFSFKGVYVVIRYRCKWEISTTISVNVFEENSNAVSFYSKI